MPFGYGYPGFYGGYGYPGFYGGFGYPGGFYRSGLDWLTLATLFVLL